jgi:UDP-N-acetylglucosamine enolpyruvyl transferase
MVKHEELTHKIIGAAMEVHNTLGSGFQEVIYQRALSIELKAAEIAFEREYEMQIIYKGKNIGTRRVDFFVKKLNSLSFDDMASDVYAKIRSNTRKKPHNPTQKIRLQSCPNP